MNPKRLEVIEKIQVAFHGVTLDDGIGLHQAQAIDDYEDEPECLRRRKTDEKENWANFDCEELIRCQSSLSFFDAKGMRFHLPAFLICELKGKADMSAEFYLTQLDDYKKEKLSLLSADQKRAIESFLWEMLESGDYEFFREDISQALEDYWMK